MRDLTPAVVADWAHRARAALRRHRREIDALNVFPVPDGDTGTNVLLTVESGVAEVDLRLPTAQEPRTALAAFAHGALLGARGNSGVILSQVLRGLSDAIAEFPQSAAVGGAAVASALQRASAAAYLAVARPVEGTILTVVRAAGDAAADLLARHPTATTSAVLHAAYQGAEAALAQTTQMLETLRRAGVVDAGGKAFVVVLGALRDAVDGTPADDALQTDALETDDVAAGRSGEDSASDGDRRSTSMMPTMPTVPTVPTVPTMPTMPTMPMVPRATTAGTAPVEVMFLLDAQEAGGDALRRDLAHLGDSVVVVGGDGLWNVHVHVVDLTAAGAVIEAALAHGRPHRIVFTPLPDDQGVGPPTPTPRGLVAVTHGDGVRALLTDAGVACVPAAPGMRAAMREILDAVEGLCAREIAVLPGDSDTHAVAEAAAQQARLRGRRVAVIPTRSVVQTLSAVAVHRPDADFDADVIAMTRAAGATRYAAVTIARRDALTTAGPCRIGDVLGLVDGDIAQVGTDVDEVARDLVSGLLALGGELVTCVFGCDAPESLRALPGWVHAQFPLVEVVSYDGGQSLWPVIIGVE